MEYVSKSYFGIECMFAYVCGIARILFMYGKYIMQEKSNIFMVITYVF